jgi:hypothetical protein
MLLRPVHNMHTYGHQALCRHIFTHSQQDPAVRHSSLGHWDANGRQAPSAHTRTCFLRHIIHAGLKPLVQAVPLRLHRCEALRQHLCLPLKVLHLKHHETGRTAWWPYSEAPREEAESGLTCTAPPPKHPSHAA